MDYFDIWKSYSFPSPLGVYNVIVKMLGSNTLAVALVSSFARVFRGYFYSLGIGLALGFIIARFKYLDDTISPLILGLQTLPNVCWVPFAILWYGLSDSSILFIVMIGAVCSIAMAAIRGIKNVDPIFIKASRTMGAKGYKLYFNVIFPAAVPDIISGMKQGWSLAWRGLMAGEMLVATKGLGQILMIGRELSDINQVAAIMIIIILIGISIDKIVFENIEHSIRYRWGLLK